VKNEIAYNFMLQKKNLNKNLKIIMGDASFLMEEAERAGWDLSCYGIDLAKKEEKSTKFSKITFALHSTSYLFYLYHSVNLVIPCSAKRVLFVSLG
jgi:hypothetical protein